MEKRKDDRDARKSLDEATDNPWQANRDDADQQAAELQTDARGERHNPNRFAPDPASEKPQAGTAPRDAQQVSKDEVKEP